MAYINQENKKNLTPKIKQVLKKYNIKATLRIEHHSVLHLNIKNGSLDLINNYYDNLDKPEIERSNYLQVGGFISDNFSGTCKNLLLEINEALNKGNFDHSDPMTDYFHVGWYTRINIGQWDKPYQLNITEGK